jgi:hypothetical protein
MSRYRELCGCIHIHYPLQKLEETFEPVGKEGNIAGLDFLILNSHTPQKNLARYEKTFKREGYFGRTLVINGEETNDKNKQNHLLVIGGSRWYGNKDKTTQVLSEITRENCLSFVPHPEGVHKLFLLKKRYCWEDWGMDNFTGIEIWSMLFDWAKTTRLYNLPVRYLGFPDNLTGPSSSILKRWDNFSINRKVVGMAGLDIHTLPLFFKPLDIKKSFAYHSIFKALRNHILLEEPLNGNLQGDKNKILDGLRSGRLFFANDLVADSSGFYFGTEDEKFIMGDAVPAGSLLIVKSPVEAKIKIVFNGYRVWEGETATKRFIPENSGVYRVEVTLNKKPWIFSNHIRII